MKRHGMYLDVALVAAMAALSVTPDAAKFNARAAAVFAKVDGVTRMFDEYIAAMKP